MNCIAPNPIVLNGSIYNSKLTTQPYLIMSYDIHQITLQDVQQMLNELELEHKSAIYKLESAYQAKRRSLIRKLKKKDIVE